MKTELGPQSAPKTVYLKDYQPYPFILSKVELLFALAPDKTTVTTKLYITRAEQAPASAPLILDGEELDLVSIALDGQALSEDEYQLTDKTLTLDDVPDKFTLTTIVTVTPAANTQLMGLYMSNGMFCTQCEAEGFRRITFYPDRPDVLSKFDVRIEADKTLFPTLLANGNPGKTGELDDNTHFAEWSDPFPKPAYLFALVGGNLAVKYDQFTTQSGREIDLQIFVQPQNIDKCDFALDALKRAMAWDEHVFGREYDLDIFMIVAVDHFNFGAMENKGLNIFNSSCVLASPTTATDADYERIESIVAHEYFHNWSGNRVTCRDWFQLCLKEGFTVFRDQEFSADQRSRGVTRIRDVRRLWATQFPEDAGPLAHPVRPEKYITIDNFYTATVYNKGAELVRMLQQLAGPEKFRQACDYYFDRNDGTAATVEDFLNAMHEKAGIEIDQFWRWYQAAGTPEVTLKSHTDGTVTTLSFMQHTPPTPDQDTKLPRHIPCRLRMIGPDGPLSDEKVIELTQEETSIQLDCPTEQPVASVFRGYSAPVKINQSLTTNEKIQLLTFDDDPFNRWAISWQLSMDILQDIVTTNAFPNALFSQYADALSHIIENDALEPALRAELLSLPTALDLSQALDVIDPVAIQQAISQLRAKLGAHLAAPLKRLFHSHNTQSVYQPNAEQAGKRALKNICLTLLCAATDEDALSWALDQARSAQNMTDEAAATLIIAVSEHEQRAQLLADFYKKWANDPLVIDKWFAWQALYSGPGAFEQITFLCDHPAFDLKNPNRVRALLGTFAMQNISIFNHQDGRAYQFYFEQLRALDKINPAVAARLLGAVESWRKLSPPSQQPLHTALSTLAEEKDLSENVYEMVTRLLN
ncbi:MAG: aminopeptidase N [bacterium]